MKSIKHIKNSTQKDVSLEVGKWLIITMVITTM